MKVTKWFFIAMTALVVTACSGSKSDSEKKDSIQSQTTEKESVQESETPKPETFIVDGKEVQLTKGVSTKEDLIKVLGDPEIDTGTALHYSWHEGGRFNEYTFRFTYNNDYSGNGKFSGVEKASMKSSY